MKLFIFLIAISGLVQAAPDVDLEENIYQNYRDQILKKNGFIKHLKGLNPSHDALYVDALEDAVEDEEQNALETLKGLNTMFYPVVEKLRVELLKLEHTSKNALPKDLKIEIENALRMPKPNFKLLHLIAANEDILHSKKYSSIVELAKQYENYPVLEGREKLDDQVISDIYHRSPDVRTFQNGAYADAVKIFMFCPKSRLYPCLMVMKDARGEPYRLRNGKLWSHKSLALSKKGLPYYARKGNTPTGVMTIDSVMPTVTKAQSFGKARRMIVNFIPKSKSEELLKSLLPESSHDQVWWKQSVSTREIGRTFLRVHGSGKINEDPQSTWYPFIRTSGCIAQRENTYDGVTYRDTQVLLNSIMDAMNLKPVYENETAVKAILYLVNIEDQNRAVELTDLKQWEIQ